MAVIVEFPQQLSFDDLHPAWWGSPALWNEREYITSIERPVEAQALLNIWLEARAIRHLGSYRQHLNDYEARILALELRCLHENPFYSAGMKYEWIAARMNGANYTARQVKAILESVTDILRNAEMVRVLDILDAAEQRRTSYFRGVVREVLSEVGGLRQAA